MKNPAVLLLIILIVSSCASMREPVVGTTKGRWTYMGKSSDGTMYHYDKNISVDGDSRDVFVKKVIGESTVFDPYKAMLKKVYGESTELSYVILKYRAYCKDRKVEMISYTDYDPDDKVILVNDDASMGRMDARPGNMFGSIYRSACI